MDPRLTWKPTQGIDYHYRHGGGVQYVLPDLAFAVRVWIYTMIE
jgi:hypothetical protein